MYRHRKLRFILEVSYITLQSYSTVSTCHLSPPCNFLEDSGPNHGMRLGSLAEGTCGPHYPLKDSSGICYYIYSFSFVASLYNSHVMRYAVYTTCIREVIRLYTRRMPLETVIVAQVVEKFPSFTSLSYCNCVCKGLALNNELD
jgi:hypothetical protein